MRQIWITKAGGPEVLKIRQAPDPSRAAGEVRIRVEASGVNFADIMGRIGLYPDRAAHARRSRGKSKRDWWS
jgi:NADPH:quinone reductase-like Zn-dependent oxidoreductase